MRQGVCCGLLLRGVSLGRNFAEFQKTRDEGVLAKFAIARLCGHFERCGLQQNVVLGLQTASFKVPAKPSYGKFGKDTLIARFLKFCKVATKGNSPQKKATKNTLAQMPSPPNYNALKVPS